MPKGAWKDRTKRSAAAKKSAAHRPNKPRGPYGMRVLPEDVKLRMRAIAERLEAGNPLAPADGPLPTPGEVGARIDAVLGKLDKRETVG
ncbi:hypothetical protein HZY97_16130 [Sphingomonas sp. R-74633]|uniref:hypothetical protein n=1 Tax=Sphingomonas sp. R-74633 TaxID=2751188 RepID=UPI0015D36889|nr:hypothetical protein [Sphingomonas sp. R-74633]NYT42301.1 hypothetical protein [Sphingomonas sp. R-74633]